MPRGSGKRSRLLPSVNESDELVDSRSNMWQWVVLWQAILAIVGGTLDLRYFNQRRLLAPTTQINCYEIPRTTNRLGRALHEAWRSRKTIRSIVTTPSSEFPSELRRSQPRIDNLLLRGEDIVKEHAKLVQDINSLRQALFVAPFADDTRDYDDSVFHEIIETTSTTTPRPTTSRITTAKPTKPSKSSSIPIILVGGASQRNNVKSQPLKVPKPTISLVGTSISPLVRHPYPFVQATSQRPVKFCMTTMPMVYGAPTTTTRRPSLWERIISAIIPR